MSEERDDVAALRGELVDMNAMLAERGRRVRLAAPIAALVSAELAADGGDAAQAYVILADSFAQGLEAAAGDAERVQVVDDLEYAAQLGAAHRIASHLAATLAALRDIAPDRPEYDDLAILAADLRRHIADQATAAEQAAGRTYRARIAQRSAEIVAAAESEVQP